MDTQAHVGREEAQKQFVYNVDVRYGMVTSWWELTFEGYSRLVKAFEEIGGAGEAKVLRSW